MQDAPPAPLRWTVSSSCPRQPIQRLDAIPEVVLPTGYIQLCGAARNYHDISLLGTSTFGGELFPDRLAQIRVLGIIDFIVQAGAILSQLFLTGRLAERLGVRMLW